MRALGAAATRVRNADMIQVLALFLATLFFVLAVRWPAGVGSNEAWFTLAPTRVTLLGLIAFAFGAAEASQAPGRRGATAGALLLLTAASAPFDVATYAASYPATPLWWSAAIPFLEVLGYLTLGTALGRVAARLRVAAFLTLLVPAVYAGLAWLDVYLGLGVFNPLAVAVHVSWRHAATMGALAAVGGVWLWRDRRQALEGSAP